MTARPQTTDPARARRWPIWLAAGLVGLALALAGAWWGLTRPAEYIAAISPDGRFRLVVYREGSLIPAMPGQGGDAPGFVRLIEVKSGRVLNEVPVQMVQLVHPIEWQPGRVSVRLLFDWPLPQ